MYVELVSKTCFNNGFVPKVFHFLLMLRGILDRKSAEVQHILLSLNRHCVDAAPREYKQPTLLLLLHRKSCVLCASKIEKFQLAIRYERMLVTFCSLCRPKEIWDKLLYWDLMQTLTGYAFVARTVHTVRCAILSSCRYTGYRGGSYIRRVITT